MRLSPPLLALLSGFLASPAWGDRMVLPEHRTARAWLGFEVRPSNLENDGADVVRITPGTHFGELVFYGRQPGRARVTARAPLGEGEVVFDIDVLEKNLHGATRVLPDLPPSVRVSVDGAYVILEGFVASADEMDQVRALADEASNVVVAVARHDDEAARVLLMDRRPPMFDSSEPRAPDIAPLDSESFERYTVTLLPGTFVIASHFDAGASDHSDRESAEAMTEGRRTLFVGRTPGRSIYVVRDRADRRWIVFDVKVLDPDRDRVQRTVPPLPSGVRISLENGNVVLEGTIVSGNDAGALEVVTAMFPGAVNRVMLGDPLPPAEPPPR